MKELALELLINLSLTLWGMAISGWYKAFTSKRDNRFSFRIMWEENHRAIKFTMAGIILTIPGFTLVPEFSNIITTLTGLSFESINRESIFNMAYITYGHLLYSLIRNKTKTHGRSIETEAISE